MIQAEERNNKRAETHFRATVKDGRGMPVAFTKHGAEVWGSDKQGWDSSGDVVVAMRPGEKWTRDLVLSKLFDLSRPGTCVIQVRWVNLQKDIESNVITVAVTD